ncbi:hypothetical protein [Mesorhizobium loti]|uniref:hypothetical protein n=1 Tax=Rhizobium loti TaxID=381 RepID=UPI0004B596E7|nr:hypothetical protein [Mesorhizobium loti]
MPCGADIKAIQYGSQLRQNNLNTQAAISRFSGKQAVTASIFKAGGNLVDGLSKIYDPSKASVTGSSAIAGRSVIFGNSPLRAPWAGNN